jgi:hypothetical protein
VHGAADRVIPYAHSQWLARQWTSAELRLRPGDGHLSVLDGAMDAMAWLAQHRR